ncbi:MAG TPA: thiamine-phosphate kinase [Actinomycetota bacterium]
MTAFTEDELIDALRTILADDAPGVRLGPGDDGALVDSDSGFEILTADVLIEGVHFDRALISPRDLGYKALTVNVSDVAAMGGRPKYGLVSLGISASVEMPWVMDLYAGLRDAAVRYGASVVGGDLSRSDAVVISVFLTGEVAKNRAVTRAGARPGDRVVVTGQLGGAAGGFLLGRATASEGTGLPDGEWARALLAAHARPVARVDEGEALAAAGASAMMDLSDGLAKDLRRLCRESEVGVRIDLPSVPVAPGLAELQTALKVDPIELALGGGEDYELLATLAPEVVGRAAARLDERFGTDLTDIGEITQERETIAVEAGGTERTLESKGWDHFAA